MERNSDLLFQIADRIENDPASYDQTQWLEYSWDANCGTTGCIAGQACHIEGIPMREAPLWPLGGSPADIAVGLLGLTDLEGYILFGACWHPPFGMTVPEALRRFAKGDSIEDVTCRGHHIPSDCYDC